MKLRVTKATLTNEHKSKAHFKCNHVVENEEELERYRRDLRDGRNVIVRFHYEEVE